MGSRLDLHEILKTVLGSTNVYFQPPGNQVMQYPCIVYQWDQSDAQHADNIPYRRTRRYQVTHISKDPDSVITDRIAQLPLCSHDRFFASNNLNHHVFTLFF